MKGGTNLNQNEADKGPINPVKGLYEIELMDESTEVSGFYRVKRFLNNTNGIYDLAIFEKPILFLRYAGVQEGLDSDRDDF